MNEDANVGAFVCSCADTCNIDLDTARERIDGVDIAASSDLLCGEETLADLQELVEARELDEVVATCPASAAQKKIKRIERETDASVSFVDQREGAGWIHDEGAATEKTARLVSAASAGLDDGDSGTVDVDVGNSVAVVGDAEFAAALPETADVTLIADGTDFESAGVDLEGVDIERGRVADTTGSIGEYELTLVARVTEDCIDCMECVREGPDGYVTATPVDIDPGAPEGEWVDVCPTDAIDLEGVTRTETFDQVVYPGASEAPIGGKIGFHTDANLETISKVSNLLEIDDRPAHLDFDMDVCASGSRGQEGCTQCSDACPHDAVFRPAADDVTFDEAACLNCGACTSSCPTGAVTLEDRSNERIAREVEALVDTEPEDGILGRSNQAIETQVVAFVCSEQAERALLKFGRMAARGEEDLEYPPILPVRVNCTDTVGEAHVLHALAAGADGVAIVGCGGECLHSGPDPKAQLVSRLNQATADLGLGKRVDFFAPDPEEPGEFVEALSSFAVLELEDTPIPAGEHEASGHSLGQGNRLPEYGNRVWSLESIRQILEYTDPDREVIRGLEGFGIMGVDEACAFTPTCTQLCPTGAIQQSDEDGELNFSHERCVNCGLCEDGCAESAITMETGLDLSLLPEYNDGDAWTTVYEAEMFACRGCGDEFASVPMIEKMKDELPEQTMDSIEGHMAEYCSDCKGEIAFQF
ncbi:hydrogenase iron-sulfur subunit [Natrialbaceae archaeon A-gly3]